ncbi:MAG: class I SAM-dependent methyltransferase [Chitinophagaceae bacterium]|nr:MAG: class I SAM-dependent methyltransferase [Chitinophagaceae bacterium]
MKQPFTTSPLQVIETGNRSISIFSTDGQNIDTEVVETFGDEWLKFKEHSDEEIKNIGMMYFDILDETIINKNTYALDIGCGTGRWTKYLADRIGFVEAIDPSNAVLAADHLLKGVENVRISQASVETIPFNDETFDFAMSIGVLHHIPDTQKAMQDCVKKVKKGGYFFTYLYYNHDRKGTAYKMLFEMSNVVRKIVSSLPAGLKRVTCDVLAVIFYMPFVFLGRMLSAIGFKKLASRLPLADYQNMNFFTIRNDSLDRFGTKLEHRFSKKEVIELMENSGLEQIVVSPNSPYYHAVGKKK